MLLPIFLLFLCPLLISATQYCTSPSQHCPCDASGCSGGSAFLGTTNWCTTASQPTSGPGTCDYEGTTALTREPWAYCAPCPTTTPSTCINCPSYNDLSAASKLTRLLTKINNNAYNVSNLTLTWPSVLPMAELSMDTTFDRFADEFPLYRTRYIHAHGAVAPVSYNILPNNLGLTGVYASGAPTALVRLSLAGDPANGVSPGFAIKFLINGQVSANVIGMYDIDTQGQNYNFFFNVLKTRIPTPSSDSFFTNLGLQAGILLFETGATPATDLNPDQPAYYPADGSESPTTPKAPKALYLVPNPALTAQFNFSIATPRSFLVDLVSIPAGTMLYTIYATLNTTLCDVCGNSEPCPAIPVNCPAVPIGQLNTTGAFVASPYVDQGIFFQHSRVNAKVRSTCTYLASLDDTNEGSTVLPTIANQVADCEVLVQCPFAAASTSLGCPRDFYNSTAIAFTEAQVQAAMAGVTPYPSVSPTAVFPNPPTNKKSGAAAIHGAKEVLMALVLLMTWEGICQ